MKRHSAGRWAVAAGLIAILAACTPQGLNIGPIPVSLPVDGGSIDPSQFVLVPGGIEFDYTTDQDFCGLPTEQEIIDQMPSIGSIDVSGLVTLKKINLSDIVLTATTGDFSFLHEITVSFVPKPVNGQEQDPVVIGYAYSPDGFGNSITLIPPDDVNLLDLIRANDDNPATGCPKIQMDVRGTKPSQLVEWEGKVDSDIYATIGR
jgi:hypothetical protein